MSNWNLGCSRCLLSLVLSPFTFAKRLAPFILWSGSHRQQQGFPFTFPSQGWGDSALSAPSGTQVLQRCVQPGCHCATCSSNSCSFGIKLVFADAFPQKGRDQGHLCVTDRSVLQPSAAQKQNAEGRFSLLLPQCLAWLMYNALQGGHCTDLCPGPLSQFAEFPVSVCGSRDVVTRLSGDLVHVTIFGVHCVSWQYASEQWSDLLLTFLRVILCRPRSVTTWNCSNFFP